MKLLLALLASSFFSFNSFAQWDDSQLVGSWGDVCTQTNVDGLKGYTLQTYTFSSDLSFEFERHWFTASDCSGEAFKISTEQGQLVLGKENLNNGFNPRGTLDANFKVEQLISKGVIWLDPEGTSMRISRGIYSGPRNTMLGLFLYTRR